MGSRPGGLDISGRGRLDIAGLIVFAVVHAAGNSSTGRPWSVGLAAGMAGTHGPDIEGCGDVPPHQTIPGPGERPPTAAVARRGFMYRPSPTSSFWPVSQGTRYCSQRLFLVPFRYTGTYGLPCSYKTDGMVDFGVRGRVRRRSRYQFLADNGSCTLGRPDQQR